MDPWIPLTFISRFLFYLAVFASIGGYFIVTVISLHASTANDSPRPLHCISLIKKHVFLACLLGIIASACEFLFLVGSFSDSGFLGIFDRTMIEILISSNAGKTTQYRVVIFLLAGLFTAFSIWRNKSSPLFYQITIWAVLSLSLSATFSVSGHLYEGGFIEKTTVIFHVLLASFWLGSLYPLILICKTSDLSFIELIMKRFSQLAMVFVIVLLGLGAALSYFLIGSWDALLFSSYGRGILLKVFLVAMLLLLAARHKLTLAPGVNQNGGVIRLQRSISVELAVGLLVLVVVAALTTIIGIDMADMDSQH